MGGGREGGEVEVMVAARSGSAARSVGRSVGGRGRLSSHLSMRGVASLTDGRTDGQGEREPRASNNLGI